MLRRCLHAIGAQTLMPAAILVVDNASTDETPRILAEEFPSVRVHRTHENLGCAGAMHEALRVTLPLSPEYIWLFDDDAIPHPTCLEVLVREMRMLEAERRVGALRIMVRDPKTGDVAGGGISQAGLLLAKMVADVELPRSALFIELSDHSYNLQIRRGGYEILRVPSVLADHPVHRPQRLRQIASEGYRVKPWRLYYAVRNRIYFNLYVRRSWRGVLSNLAVALRALALLTLFGRPRRGQTFVIRGIIDGFLARLGRRVEPGY
jgi:rhamnopyranosyl-N-acetylglucosaminyl-diphospho-decaprenol beta-1,3/1,4-galactofuranosyltransferase